jgi:hypothetical protein
MWKSAGVFCEFYPGICLTAEVKVWKNLSQGKKNLSQSTYYQKHPHITKIHTHTHITKQYKTTTVKINPLNAELIPICHLLVLLGAHLILHVSRIKVKTYSPRYRKST